MKKNIIRSVILLLSIPFILNVIWFRNGLIFGGGEDALPFYNLARHFKLTSTIWYESGTGWPIFLYLSRIPFFYILKVLYELSIPGFLLQAITFYVLMTTGVVSVYFLLYEVFDDKTVTAKRLAISLIGAIFYLLSPLSMIHIWGRGLYMQFFGFALLPLFFLFIVLGLKRRNYLYAGFALTASFIFSSAYVSVSYVVTLWLLSFLYLLYYLTQQKKNKKNIRFSLSFFTLLFLGWILTSIWWLTPFIVNIGIQSKDLLLGVEHNLGSLRGISRDTPFFDILRMVHRNFWYRARIYGDFYVSLPALALSWSFPLIALFSIKLFKKLQHFKFFALLFSVSFFIALGSNFPTGWFFEFIFKNFTFFQVFRNPIEKIAVLFILAYTPFFAIGVLSIAEKISKFGKVRKYRLSTNFFVAVIVFLLCGVYVWPIWTGIHAGGVKVNTWVGVPKYYSEADEWLRQKNGDFRILHLPLIPGDGLKYTWENSYQGTDPSEFLFDKESIAKKVVVPNYPDIYLLLLDRLGRPQYQNLPLSDSSARSEFDTGELIDELAKLNVRYIVLHHDVDPSISESLTIEETQQFLDKQNGIEKVETFGSLDIYKVIIPENIDLIYSSDAEISFEKISPTSYLAHVKNASGSTTLYFLNTYNEAWEASINGETVNTHGKVFGYANKWIIDKNGDFNVSIKYKPQEYIDYGIKIALLSLTLLIVLLAFYQWKLKGKNLLQ